MPNALQIGVSGLTSHEKMLEVVGHNLANANTTAFKSRRVLFSDLMYEGIRSTAAEKTGILGSINPSQIGNGVKVANVDVDFNQGELEPTGDPFDMAIEGNGFFVVDGGPSGQLYTRAGSFRLDEQGSLVDPATGFRVQRFGAYGEPEGLNAGFQVPGDSSIRIPLGAAIGGQGTDIVNIAGNLKAGSTGPVERRLQSFRAWTVGGLPATATTQLNQLDGLTQPYVTGDQIQIVGAETNGNAVSANFSVTPTSTLGDLVNFIDSTYSSSGATLDASGKIVLTADATGPSLLSMTLSDASTNQGNLALTTNPLVVAAAGKDGDRVQGGIQVFDIRGGAHVVNLTFQKQADSSWTMTAALDATDGTVIDGSVQRITFNPDGSFAGAGDTGMGDLSVSFSFTGIPTPQVMRFGFGDPNSLQGLTELASTSSIAAQQNGFAPGKLISVRIKGTGEVEGVTSNGRAIPLAQLAVASFRNTDGLQSVGDNFYSASVSAGEPEIGTGQAGERGTIRSGQLERSNVDMATEFTRLIVAQRGFSANARTITVASETLEEVLGLVR
jgi:flagellar hook protein FlgE